MTELESKNEEMANVKNDLEGEVANMENNTNEVILEALNRLKGIKSKGHGKSHGKVIKKE